jgi:hypothetical protein
MVNRLSQMFLLGVGLPLLLAGCAHDRERWDDSSIAQSMSGGESVATLNAVANDPAKNQEDRARAIFVLFARFVRPGCSSAEIHRVLTNVSWLRDADVYAVRYFAGWGPIMGSLDDTIFEVRPFPGAFDLRPSQWCVAFSLSGDLREGDAMAFLKGDPSVASPIRMREFALCYPASLAPGRSMGRFEVFSTRGIHVYNEWGAN